MKTNHEGHYIGFCEDKRCYTDKSRTKRLYVHSTIYYNPELYEETGQEYYHACSACCLEDYEKFDRGEIKGN